MRPYIYGFAARKPHKKKGYQGAKSKGRCVQFTVKIVEPFQLERLILAYGPYMDAKYGWYVSSVIMDEKYQLTQSDISVRFFSEIASESNSVREIVSQSVVITMHRPKAIQPPPKLIIAHKLSPRFGRSVRVLLEKRMERPHSGCLHGQVFTPVVNYTNTPEFKAHLWDLNWSLIGSGYPIRGR